MTVKKKVTLKARFNKKIKAVFKKIVAFSARKPVFYAFALFFAGLLLGVAG